MKGEVGSGKAEGGSEDLPPEAARGRCAPHFGLPTSDLPLPGVSAEEIRAAYLATMEEAEVAVKHIGASIRKAVACGKKLIQAKAERPGTFDAWLAAEVPEICAMTAWRWRKLAEAPEALWANATSLRQAYIDVGILPAPAPAEVGESNRPAGNYLVYLSRAERALRRQFAEIGKLSRDERTSLKARLEPLVKIYAEL